MVWGVPAGFLESRSLLADGELPLWDRYGHAGSPFLGQAETMLGDPLQMIVILGRGAAGAWDLKFLAAKFLFCAGFGLLVFRLLASLPVASLFAALAAYCGAFFYIYNHPVFFPFCYSPWILLSAIELLELNSDRYLRWGVAWLLANFACFNGGHVEVAVVLIGGLNLAALAHALTSCRRAREWAVVLGRMAAATALFLGLTAPVWMAFLASLPGAFSMHSAVRVFQLEPPSLVGLFDDLFYYFLLPKDALQSLAPGCSLLVLAGCLLSVIRWRALRGMRFFWVNTAAVVFWGACAFGGVPARVLEAVPLLNRVGHNFVDFSYLLILHLTIQCAYGFKAFAAETQLKRAAVELLWTLLGFGALVVWYRLSYHTRPLLWRYFLGAEGGALGALLLQAYLKQRRPRISIAGWTGVVALAFLAQFRFGMYNLGDENLMTVPGPRMVLDAPSPAVDRIKKESADPFRVVGWDQNFLGDYATVYGLEDIRSCAPLTSGSFMDLVVNSPGINLTYGWIIKVADPVAAQPLLNLLNVKYFLAPPGVGLEAGLDYRLTDRSDFGVLENLNVWPRAFFTDRVTPVASTGEFIQRLWANSKKPFAALAPAEIARQPGLQKLVAGTNAAVSAATHYHLRPNSTAFDLHAPAAGLACLTENQAPDFMATVNGHPATILTVNQTFKGVYLDQPGDYHIEFTYRPRHWVLACAFFWTALVVTAALVAGSFRRAKRRETSEPVPT